MSTSALRPESETRLWYEDKVRRFGYDHRGLGFRTRAAQERRFEALLAAGDFEGRTVLDVGCGFGDFLGFLLDRGIHPVYAGLDICAPMIARCHQRFPASAGIFAVGDVLEFEPRHTYDYVIASGIFGLAAKDARERIRPTLERLFGWARLGVAVNFLSARSPEKVERRLYVEPAEALDWAFALTPAASLDHTYLPNDFTLHMRRTPSWSDAAEGDAP